MDKNIIDNHLAILKGELKVALGCTEPIAIAFVAAKARDILEAEPVNCVVRCSGNIIKNVKGVTVPNSGGMRGIAVSAVLGIVGGDAERELAVLETIKPEHIEKTKKLLEEDFCSCELAPGIENLYIDITVTGADGSTAQVIAKTYHSNITKIVKNNKVILEVAEGEKPASTGGDKSLLTLENIIEFANEAPVESLKEIIMPQVEKNSAISQEGLDNAWGAEVGRTLLETATDIKTRAAAAAAAGSDARMNGCAMPVVINSGSGNQGITVTMPIVQYAKERNISLEKMIRALAVANLVSVHQKKYIGSLSAYCGAVSAAAASAAGISYMDGDDIQVIADTITNTIGCAGGIVCDGAKSSCAAKIATSVNSALTGWQMAKKQRAFQPGEGLVKNDVEQTIAAVGRMGKDGMHSTDIEILNIMLED